MDFQNFGDFVNFIILGLTWLIVQPLKAGLASLEASINNLATEISGLRQDTTNNRVDIATLKESLKDAHFRINEVSDDMKTMKNECKNCDCIKGLGR